MFTDQEHDMARRGYVYYVDSGKMTGFRKQCRNLAGQKREALIFDRPAYQTHKDRGIGAFKKA